MDIFFAIYYNDCVILSFQKKSDRHFLIVFLNKTCHLVFLKLNQLR